MVEELSEGGQGVTAICKRIGGQGELAVLKRIVPRWRGDAQARSRLAREAEVLAKLAPLGAKVPKLYDSHASNDPDIEPFLLMEYVPGERFDRWLLANAPVPIGQAAAIVMAISETIQLCHENGIGHRDLKPANIILRDSLVEQPYVLDFGITFDSGRTEILTDAGEIFRNEFISLPECMDMAGGHRDIRSDITSIAGLFYHCIAGLAPIVLRDAKGLAPHQRQSFAVRSAARDAIEAERLMWFFNRAFSYNIDDRFGTLDEFRKELSGIVFGTSVPRLSFADELQKFEESARLKNRDVQLALLRGEFALIREAVQGMASRTLTSGTPAGINVGFMGLNVDAFREKLPQLTQGTLLDGTNVATVSVGRKDFPLLAVAMFTGFAVGMEIHVYLASYIASQENIVPVSLLEWRKIAAVPGNSSPFSEAKQLIFNEVQLELAGRLRSIRMVIDNG